jgi:hypothetical protein
MFRKFRTGVGSAYTDDYTGVVGGKLTVSVYPQHGEGHPFPNTVRRIAKPSIFQHRSQVLPPCMDG